MTAQAASYFKLKESHTINIGETANITLFDPKTILDHATYVSPLTISQGIIAVWVQGKQAYSQKEGVLGKFGSLLTRQS
jgi:N-acyl-D-amino-acid deacylase